MNILVIQLRQLGDILLSTPVIRALKSRDPSLKVDVMTYPMGRLIIPGNPLVHKHLIAPQKGVVDSLRFVRDLQKHSYDAVIDFMSTPRWLGQKSAFRLIRGVRVYLPMSFPVMVHLNISCAKNSVCWRLWEYNQTIFVSCCLGLKVMLA